MLPLIAATLALSPFLVGTPESPSGVATCERAIIGNPPVAGGPIRFFEYAGWAQTAVEKPDGSWDVKMGAAVRGTDPVTVRVLPRHQGRAALIYGERGPKASITFEPCPEHRTSTGWAGGVRLEKLRRFTVEIRAEGRAPIREVLLDRPRRLPGG